MANAKPSSTKVSLFLVSILVVLASLQISSADEIFVDNICKSTPLPDSCKSLLLSDPRGLQAATLKDLTLIALDMTINGALALNRKAADLARQYRGQPEQEPLSQCGQIYVDFTTMLGEVAGNVRSSSFKNVYEWVNASAQKPVDCENEFASRGLDSPLLQDDMDLEHKATLAANLAYLIKKFLGD